MREGAWCCKHSTGNMCALPTVCGDKAQTGVGTCPTTQPDKPAGRAGVGGRGDTWEGTPDEPL